MSDVLHVEDKWATRKTKYECIVDRAAVGHWSHCEELDVTGLSSSGSHIDEGMSNSAGATGVPLSVWCWESPVES